MWSGWYTNPGGREPKLTVRKLDVIGHSAKCIESYLVRVSPNAVTTVSAL